jgi:hypothetical protein
MFSVNVSAKITNKFQFHNIHSQPGWPLRPWRKGIYSLAGASLNGFHNFPILKMSTLRNLRAHGGLAGNLSLVYGRLIAVQWRNKESALRLVRFGVPREADVSAKVSQIGD